MNQQLSNAFKNQLVQDIGFTKSYNPVQAGNVTIQITIMLGRLSNN
jgi:hypothetical protein